jgi:hypothetical protein
MFNRNIKSVILFVAVNVEQIPFEENVIPVGNFLGIATSEAFNLEIGEFEYVMKRFHKNTDNAGAWTDN